MRPLSQRIKGDIAIVPQNLGAPAVSYWYNLGKYGRAIFWWEVGAMAAAATSDGQIMQARNAAGDGAKAVAGLASQILANRRVTAATLTVDTVVAGDKVTINGVEFEAAAAADLPNRKFAVGANNGACATSLAEAINHAAGVPGITAEANAAVVTLTATEPGEETITITDPAVTITPATLRAIGFLEVDASQLDTDENFSHVAIRITNSAATLTAAFVERGDPRWSPEQQAAAGN